MTGKPYQVGQKYLYQAVTRQVIATTPRHIFVVTEPVGGVVYNAIFVPAGESMNGRVIQCTYCEEVSRPYEG